MGTESPNLYVSPADLDFLAFFEKEEDAKDADAVLGMAVAPVPQPEAMMAPVVPAAPAPVGAAPAAPAVPFPAGMMQGQMPAMLPAQATYADALQQQYAQAILQQQMIARMQGVSHKRTKSPAEAAEQEERIKRRRRESAQRSRQRKSAYMKSLECENHALKLENDRLRMELARNGHHVSPPTSIPNFASLTTSGSSAGGAGQDPLALFDHTGATTSSDGLCMVDASGLGGHAAEVFMGMAL